MRPDRVLERHLPVPVPVLASVSVSVSVLEAEHIVARCTPGCTLTVRRQRRVMLGLLVRELLAQTLGAAWLHLYRRTHQAAPVIKAYPEPTVGA